MLEGLIEYTHAKFGPTFSRGVDIFPVLECTCTDSVLPISGQNLGILRSLSHAVELLPLEMNE